VLVHQSHTRRAPIAYLWPLSQVLHAAVILGDAPAAAAMLAQLERYEQRGGLAHHPGEPDRYYDDNAWVGLACAQLTAATGDVDARRWVERTWRFGASGQQPDGGVAWVDVPRPTINTCSTAPLALLALRAGRLGVATGAVAFATLADRYLVTRLRRADQLYGDHVRIDGTIDTTVFSYNQGSVVALQALLAADGGDERHLDEAHATAVAALREYRGDRLFTHPPAFNAVFLRGLLLLDAVRPVPDVRDVLDEYLERVWRDARDARTGTFVGGGIGRYDEATTLDHAGLVQLFALAAWPRERCSALC
jgi:hypothetical protein